ncbi:Mu-like prophage major head subunit gpT family protein [Serratia sp. SM59]
MAIVTPALVKSLFVSFNKAFQDGLKVADSDYTKIATVIKSTTATNIYAWLGQFPQMREWVGARIIKDMKTDGYGITNKLYEATVGVPRTAIEDDSVGVYLPVMTEAGRSAGVYPDEHIFALLKAGETSLCYDGQNFFDTEHPVAANVDGTGTITPVSNLLTPAGTDPASPAPWYLMCTKRALKPLIFQERIKPDLKAKTSDDTSDHVFMNDEFLYGVRARSAVGFGFWQFCVKSTKPLTAENYQEAYTLLRNMVADGGRPLNIKGDLLVVPPTLAEAARKIVGVATINGGEDNPNYKLSDILDTAWLI